MDDLNLCHGFKIVFLINDLLLLLSYCSVCWVGIQGIFCDNYAPGIIRLSLPCGE